MARMFAVLDVDGQHLEEVSYKDAKLMRDRGEAVFGNRRAIQLVRGSTYTKERGSVDPRMSFPRHGISSAPSVRTMDLYVDGDKHAIAAILGSATELGVGGKKVSLTANYGWSAAPTVRTS